MWCDKRIAVIVPAYAEERLIARTLLGMPDWVDDVIVVDDASPDRTAEEAAAVADPRVVVVRHVENLGVGAAIARGYREALRRGADVLAVMAGDAQMDPRDLPRVIEPVARGQVHYVKGNRLHHPEARRMPPARRLGTRVLARVTRAATGLRIGDSQCGYTALSRMAAERLPLDELWPRFGYPNDLLGMLAARQLSVEEVPVRPVYADEKSGLRPWHALGILWVITRRYARERSRDTATSLLGDVA